MEEEMMGSMTLAMMAGKKRTSVRHWSAAVNRPSSVKPASCRVRIIRPVQRIPLVITPDKKPGRANCQMTDDSVQISDVLLPSAVLPIAFPF